MESFYIYPILGLKTSVAQSDASLFQMISQNTAAVHCVEGRNIDFGRTQNACAKSVGQAIWSNSATASTTTCLGIFYLDDGTNVTYWIIYDGNVYRYNGTRDPVEVVDAGATAFASGTMDFYSMIRYGNYFIFADRAEHEPYCSDNNDANLLKLISSGTAYKFRYLESFQRRIIGAYSDQTDGDIEIRWSNLMPTPNTDCVFATTNQLYVPNDDPITGIRRMGRNACFVYCKDSINRLDYYPDYSSPFGFTTILENQGAANHHSIVDVGNQHFFLNRNYGFCSYNGGNQIIPISRDIENWVSGIRESYYPHIIGQALPFRNRVAWTVPLEGSTTPNAILLYDYFEKKWERRDIACRYLAPMVISTDLTWTKLTTDLGFTTWADMGNLRWADLVTETPVIALSGTDGKLYYLGTEANETAAWDGYRVEPMMNFGKPNNKSVLEEIWFSLADVGDYSLYVYYRGGDTEGALKAANWTATDEVDCNSPNEAVCRLNNVTKQAYRYHQIKWGTDGADEPFVVNQIEFRYVPESGSY